MMNELSFYRDDQGSPRTYAKSEEAGVLGGFLESDIQDDVVTCKELLARIEGGIDEHDDPVEFTGNRHSVTFTHDTVIITTHSAEETSSAMLEPHQVEMALRGWLTFIES